MVEVARRELAAGQTRLHIVAPPGSGKTVLGLYLWAECIRAPALVLSPNSAIQAQWVAKLDLFDFPGGMAGVAGADPQTPRLLTSLTYQAVTLPRRGGEDIDSQAVELWINKLVEKGQAKDPEEAEVWIEDLKRHNRDYYAERLGVYRKAARDAVATAGEALRTLHISALETLQRLKQAGIGVLILDECHHLLGHWGRVLAVVHRYFEHPIVLGLTATPPDRRGKSAEDVKRYDELFGPIDYEIPTPAVVKDGFLAPYQDLVQFVRPTPEELAYVANADQQLHDLVEEFCRHSDCESLTDWLLRVLTERPLPIGAAKDWATFEKRDHEFAWAARAFLQYRGIPLPSGVPSVPPTDPRYRSLGKDALHDRSAVRGTSRLPPLAMVIPVLDRFIRHRLRPSEDPVDHERAERAIQRLRMLGTQVTETGSQACASPISRVLAYARGKVRAIVPILKVERRALGERIRAIIVTDFEKSSAVSAGIGQLLDEEAGGAIAAYRELLSDPETDALDPILVTGSTVLVDDDLAERFDAAAAEWLGQRKLEVELEFGREAGFHVLAAHGADWGPRIYVEMVTDLFQRGLTKCLVGTRGLLGEGWDATKVNVLVDLTTVTTSTSVNQLRGRSLRLDPDDPEKLADNWDVVCIAPEFAKGLDDYYRFLDKHDALFGLTDDGVVEKGVGHVHAAFTELEPQGVEDSLGVLNAEMLERPQRRSTFRGLWRVGEPFHAKTVAALELRRTGARALGFPPFAEASAAWTDTSLTLAIGRAVLGALVEAELVTTGGEVHVAARAGGYVRTFLGHAGQDDGRLFSESLQEALGPLDQARYVVPRYVDYRTDTWLSRILPHVLGRHFQRHRRQMVMLHAVPSALAKNKEQAAIYNRHWNAHVSPGQVAFALQGAGKALVEKAQRDGAIPAGQIRRKEIFLLPPAV
jgi:superfamily II DNA or RNA helicase